MTTKRFFRNPPSSGSFGAVGLEFFEYENFKGDEDYSFELVAGSYEGPDEAFVDDPHSKYLAIYDIPLDFRGEIKIKVAVEEVSCEEQEHQTIIEADFTTGEAVSVTPPLQEGERIYFGQDEHGDRYSLELWEGEFYSRIPSTEGQAIGERSNVYEPDCVTVVGV